MLQQETSMIDLKMTFNDCKLTAWHFKSASNHLKTTPIDMKKVFSRLKQSSIHRKRTSNELQTASAKLKLTLFQLKCLLFNASLRPQGSNPLNEQIAFPISIGTGRYARNDGMNNRSVIAHDRREVRQSEQEDAAADPGLSGEAMCLLQRI